MILAYVLQLADNALIIGQRMSEWSGHGPILEQDIALTNGALDHIGRARSLYQYAAELFNAMPASEKATYFTSVAIQNIVASGESINEDHLAYLRDAWDFKNTLLVEQPNGDWAMTVVRGLFNDAYNYFYFSQLANSKDENLAAIAQKSLKEVTYHLRWSSEWVIRLGDGNEESNKRVSSAVIELWSFTGEMFEATDLENAMASAGISPDLALVKKQWHERVSSVLLEATLEVPTASWMQSGGKQGRHTEHLGYMLAEMQYMQRTYPGMEW